MLAPGEEAILVLQRRARRCERLLLSEKVETAQLLGYDAVIIANHHSGGLGGEGPDAYLLRRAGAHLRHRDLGALRRAPRDARAVDDPNAADNWTYPEDVPAVGTVANRISTTTQFDGWGYVHLYGAATGEDLDTYAIPEAMDPAYASG